MFVNSSVHMLLPFIVGRLFSHAALIKAGLDVQKVSRRCFTSGSMIAGLRPLKRGSLLEDELRRAAPVSCQILPWCWWRARQDTGDCQRLDISPDTLCDRRSDVNSCLCCWREK